MLAIPSSVVPAESPAAEPLRDRLQLLRDDCLRERSAVLAALAQEAGDPVLLARSESLLRTIEDIAAALARMEAGTYGTCRSCAGVIPAERLELRPFATTCVACAAAG